MLSSGMESVIIPISEKPAVLHCRWRITSTAIYENYNAAALFYFPHGMTAKVALGLLIIEVSRSHSVVHKTHCMTPLGTWLDYCRSLPDNTQHSQEMETHAPNRIQMRNPSEQLHTHASWRIQTWTLCHSVRE